MNRVTSIENFRFKLVEEGSTRVNENLQLLILVGAVNSSTARIWRLECLIIPITHHQNRGITQILFPAT